MCETAANLVVCRKHRNEEWMKEKDNVIYEQVNKQKLGVLTCIFSFVLVWKLYWWIFNLVSPQNNLVDIIAIFGIFVVIVPCTAVVNTFLSKFLKR